jgi:hypothetical protein
VSHLLRHGTSVFKVISGRPVILSSECRALGEEAITTYFKRLRFDASGPSGARTHDLETTTTRLQQPVLEPRVKIKTNRMLTLMHHRFLTSLDSFGVSSVFPI